MGKTALSYFGSVASRFHAQRYLIVNADDFGQSAGINRGVIRAHENGVVTSASLMVRWPAAVQAAASCRGLARLSVGLHVDLGEWVYRDHTWVAVYEVVPTDDAAAVAQEVSRQLSVFRQLTGRDPTHVDSHQHVHREEPVRSVLLEVASELGVPLRHYTAGIRYCGDFYGQTPEGSPLPEAISRAALTGILSALPAGWTELGCHPGGSEELQNPYREERAKEVEVLCHPRVRASIAAEGIGLRSFADIPPNRKALTANG